MKNSLVTDFGGKFKRFFKNDKFVRILIICVILGMILIFLSECDFGKNKETQTNSNSQGDYIASYTKNLEDKIQKIISSIEGVGSAEVLITLQSGEEYVFAQEQKTNTDSTRDYSGSSEKKVAEKQTDEKNYIIVEDENGNKKALVKKTLEPAIKGVVIVCEGAENLKVQESVIESVTTALDISWDKVCISKKSNLKTSN